MKFKNRLFEFVWLFSVLCFVALIIIKPQPCKEGCIRGLLLCGRVLIPSLFPFTVCVIFIMRTGVLNKLNFLNSFTKSVLGLDCEEFSVMLLSFIGGYPVGAKLLNLSVTDKNISPKKAGIMLNYCVNAGPAFIIAAVGNGILGSQKLGVVLFGGHILSSLVICFFSRFLNSANNPTKNKNTENINPADNFVLSVSQAAESVFSVCCFVILFSGINSYALYFSATSKIFTFVTYILEVTNAITLTNNIYLISFLLGFGGICIWCQVIAVGNKININFPLFVLSRISQGILSVLFTKLIINLFGIAVPTLSNGRNISFNFLYSTPSLSISMLIMCIVLIISLTTKKYAGKILEDVV